METWIFKHDKSQKEQEKVYVNPCAYAHYDCVPVFTTKIREILIKFINIEQVSINQN